MSNEIPIRVMENDTPETNAKEWPIWPPNTNGEMFMVPSEFARKLERERNEARIQYRSTLALAMPLANTQIKLKKERDEARDEAARYRSLYYTQLGISTSASTLPWEESK